MEPRDINELSNRIEYSFRKKELLEEALSHSSYVNESGKTGVKDNERLEFLGDAVLDLAVSDILMEFFEFAKEGDLSKYRAIVVNERGLCKVARELDLGKYILLGRGEELTNGREKSSILANTMEALLGALYMDAGFDATKRIIRKLFTPLIMKIDSGKLVRDYKSKLQEFTQEVFKIRPEYKHTRETGPAHDRTFSVKVVLNKKVIAQGEGKTKKQAEQNAAREAFYCLLEERKEN